MAGAYSAVVSVMTVMDNLRTHHQPPLSLHPQQAESLTQHLTFFKEFLESYDQTLPYSPVEEDPFESRIANAAHAAEDAIESCIVDRITGGGEGSGESVHRTIGGGEGSSESYFAGIIKAVGEGSSESPIMRLVGRIIGRGQGSSVSGVVDMVGHIIGGGAGSRETHFVGRIIGGEEGFSESHFMYIVGRMTGEGEGGSSGSGFGGRIICGEQGSSESHMVDRIRGGGEGSIGSKPNQHDFYNASLYEALEKVIEDMALIQKEAIEIKQTMTMAVQHQPMPSYSFRSSSITERRSMVGVDDLLLQMKEKLVSDYRRDLHAISIVGMGGAGKTTLAINIYQDHLIKDHFDVRAWATISQEYNIREILVEVLKELKLQVDKHSSEELLGEILHKHLFGRRYLIVMDDMWSIEAGEGIMKFLPDNGNGSRIVVTTRLLDLAFKLSNTNSLKMKFLDETDSWDLLSKTVFGEEGCPPELEEIGKEISKSCKGLPLSIVVIGGFLATSPRTVEFWKDIKHNLSLIVPLGDYDRCLEILYMSYKQLPIYLKPCFLYMGVFREGDLIIISSLVKLWVAEGFVKLESGGSTLEETAKVYIKDLVDRNLIWIHHEMNFGFNVKLCKIHDLLRDLCLREAEKERFYTLTPQGIANGQRRVVINNTSKNEVINALSSVSTVRSLFWNLNGEELPTPNLRLLRILHSPVYTTTPCEKIGESVHHFVNSRFLQFSVGSRNLEFSLSIQKFWNLQTLIVEKFMSVIGAPTDIWHMPYVRYLQFLFGIQLPDPPKGYAIVLGNLQTIDGATDFKCSDQVLSRIPNIKKLYISYHWCSINEACLTNLNRLKKLKSLSCDFSRMMNSSGTDSLSSLINFPDSLKRLVLNLSRSEYWEQELFDKIGSLPFLEKLKLRFGKFEDGKWETTEGQFRSLKCLDLERCENLQVWTIESSHFPCLSRLRLDKAAKVLKEFPLDLAEVSTLRLIEVYDCTDSAVVSLKSILEENEELNGEPDIEIQIKLWRSKEEITESKTALEDLRGPCFRIQWEGDYEDDNKEEEDKEEDEGDDEDDKEEDEGDDEDDKEDDEGDDEGDDEDDKEDDEGDDEDDKEDDEGDDEGDDKRMMKRMMKGMKRMMKGMKRKMKGMIRG